MAGVSCGVCLLSFTEYVARPIWEGSGRKAGVEYCSRLIGGEEQVSGNGKSHANREAQTHRKRQSRAHTISPHALFNK